MVGERDVLLHRYDCAFRDDIPAGQPVAHRTFLPFPCKEKTVELLPEGPDQAEPVAAPEMSADDAVGAYGAGVPAATGSNAASATACAAALDEPKPLKGIWKTSLTGWGQSA